ncbi:uncharacterized protein [Typha latifolia]|uniref:uncharacterized protein n=1 Tax=Typha latifolia TaxID=4733 RepID=UPI003C2DCDC5
MKASIKFRDDQKPLLRAKVPISVLGFPFLSGIAAGDVDELRLDLATAFDSGPSFRVSYRPNDAWNPFSLVVKTGIGAFGSPIAAPIAMTAEFNLLGRNPAFSILFKPRFGDFSVRKTIRSNAAVVGKIDTNGEKRSVNGEETPIVNGFHGAANGGIGGLVSDMEVSSRSVLPLWSRTTVRFRWGFKIPPEFRSAIAGGGGKDPMAGISFAKLPLLVMSKITIEHLADERKANEKKTAEEEACFLVKRELGALRAESGVLRRAVEDLRAEIGGRKFEPAAVGRFPGGDDVSKGGSQHGEEGSMG